MTTATMSRKRVKPERHVSLSKPCNGAYALAITIGTGEKAKHFGYYVSHIPADFGMGFRFEKFSTEQEEGESSEYDVNIDLQHGKHTCECKGHQRWNQCKHTEALVSLINSGKIAIPALKQPEAPKPEVKESWCKVCNDNRDVYCPHCSL